jgi:hypothetical protein
MKHDYTWTLGDFQVPKIFITSTLPFSHCGLSRYVWNKKSLYSALETKDPGHSGSDVTLVVLATAISSHLKVLVLDSTSPSDQSVPKGKVVVVHIDDACTQNKS